MIFFVGVRFGVAGQNTFSEPPPTSLVALRPLSYGLRSETESATRKLEVWISDLSQVNKTKFSISDHFHEMLKDAVDKLYFQVSFQYVYFTKYSSVNEMLTIYTIPTSMKLDNLY
jgi:hypothetical protein